MKKIVLFLGLAAAASDAQARGVADFFSWLWTRKVAEQPEKKEVSENVAPTEQQAIGAPEEKPSEETPVRALPAEPTISEEEMQWVVEVLWSGVEPDTEQKDHFFAALELIGRQEGGFQKLLRGTRGNLKMQYVRVTRKWRGNGDDQFSQQVLEILHELYLKLF